MLLHSYFSILLICFIQLALSNNELPDMVIHIFNNGASYPTSIPDSLLTFNATPGQIMPMGLRQHYNLGILMAKKYSHLLSKADSSTISMQSIGTLRSNESAYAQMFGIFKDKSDLLPAMLASDATRPVLYTNITSIDDIMNEAGKSVNSIPHGFIPINISIFNSQENNITSRSEDSEEKQIEENASEVSEIFTYLDNTVTELKQLGYKVDDLLSLAHIGEALRAIYLDGRIQELPENMRYGTIIYNDAVFASQWYTTFKLTRNKDEMINTSSKLREKISIWSQELVQNSTRTNFISLSGEVAILLPLLGVNDIVNHSCLLTNYKYKKANMVAPYPNCMYPSDANHVIYELYSSGWSPYTRFLYNGRPLKIFTKHNASDHNLDGLFKQPQTIVILFAENPIKGCMISFITLMLMIYLIRTGFKKRTEIQKFVELSEVNAADNANEITCVSNSKDYEQNRCDGVKSSDSVHE